MNFNIKNISLSSSTYLIFIILALFILFYFFSYKKISKENFNSTSKIHAYNFNTSWCGYSRQFEPIWNEFCDKVKNRNNIVTKDIKCDDDSNNEICNRYQSYVPGYPTVLFIKEGHTPIEYDGPREVDSLLQKVNSLC